MNKARKIGVFCVVFAFHSAVLWCQDVDALVKKAVDELAGMANLKTRITVTIDPVRINNSDSVSALSQYLGVKIAQNATRSGLFSVAAATRGIPMKGMGQPGGGPQARVTAGFTKLGDSLEVTLDLVSATNDVVLASTSFMLPVKTVEALGLDVFPGNVETQADAEARQEQFRAFAGNANPFQLKAWPDREDNVYHEGETMFVSLQAEKDCYFLVYHVDTENRRQLIYPNKYEQNANRLRAGEVRRIPQTSVFLITGPDLGEERILVFASDQPFTIPESERADRSLGRSAAPRPSVSRGMAVQAKDATTQFAYTTTR